MDTRMSAKSERFHERLKEANLFSKVGNVLEGNFRRVYSWDEAIQIFFDDDQDDDYTTSSNYIRKKNTFNIITPFEIVFTFACKVSSRGVLWPKILMPLAIKIRNHG